MNRSVLVLISLTVALASPLQAEQMSDASAPMIAATAVSMDTAVNLHDQGSGERNVSAGPIIEAKSAAPGSEGGEFDLSYLLVIGVGIGGLLWIRPQAHNL